jgi:hypothetical protein
MLRETNSLEEFGLMECKVEESATVLQALYNKSYLLATWRFANNMIHEFKSFHSDVMRMILCGLERIVAVIGTRNARRIGSME